MSFALLRRIVWAPVVLGCSGGPPESTTSPQDPCADALVLSADRSMVPTLASAALTTTRVSKALTFRFVANRSGGLVSSTGDYVAGPVAGVVDQLEVADPACRDAATIEVPVVTPMDAVPATAVVPSGTSLRVFNRGGSGELTCEGTLGSGGTLVGCDWTAGTRGLDEIRVTDPQTREQLSLRYEVDPDAALRFVGERLFLPVGHPFEVAFTGGTPERSFVTSDPDLVWSGSMVTATRAGTYTLTVQDDVVPELAVTVPIVAVEPLVASLERDGLGLEWGSVATGDIDGDGHVDAVVGSVDVSVGAFGSGAVYLYAGTATGLELEPHAVFTVDQAGAGMGRSVALGDLDGDGLVDLAVGIDAYDEGGASDQGRVEVYPGVEGGFFDSVPAWVVNGSSAFDHLGSGLALCDVDGDGIDDLAASGYGIEESGQMRPNEGGIYVWRGDVAGVSGAPDWTVFSQRGNFGMGRTLAGGDIDDDGLCDLASASLTRAEDGAGQDGIVWLFTGETLAGKAPHEADRVYSVASEGDGALFGRALAFGSVDEDEVDELVVGAFRDDGAGNDRGAVYVFSSLDFAAQSDTVWGDDASAVIRGEADGAGLGQGVAVVDGSVWVGAPGTQQVFRFDAGAVRGLVGLDQAVDVWAGAAAGFGSAVGEGVAYAFADDAYGVRAGAPWALEAGAPAARLAFPADASGGGLGAPHSFAWLDHDGNGVFDLMAGTRGAPDGGFIDVGAVQQWSGFSGRWATEPDRALQAPGGFTTSERFGARVKSAGDFDGDGVEDLLVVADGADRPAGFDGDSFINPDACPGEASNSGAIWIFRGGSTRPSFVIYGATVGSGIDVVASGFDHDGDGLHDLAFSSPLSGPAGAVSIVHGQTAYADGTYVICEARTLTGVSAGSRVGAALSGVGDVDGDGCDELAVGADGDDLGLTDQGSVRVLFGWGPRCPGHHAPQVATLVSGLEGSRFGTSLAGGVDADGDEVPDLAVAGVSSDGDGSVWLISGAWLASADRDAAEVLPAGDGTTRARVPDTSRFDAPEAGTELGRSLALVPDQSSAGGGWVAAGDPGGAVGGTAGAGGVWLLALDGTGRLDVVGMVGGASSAPGVRMGEALAADPRTGLLAVGAPGADVGAVDGGAIYPFWVR